MLCLLHSVPHLPQDLGGHVGDTSRVSEHSPNYTTNIDRVSPQLYYSVVVTDIKVGNDSVALSCREVRSRHTTHTHTHTHTHNFSNVTNHYYNQPQYRRLVKHEYSKPTE